MMVRKIVVTRTVLAILKSKPETNRFERNKRLTYQQENQSMISLSR